MPAANHAFYLRNCYLNNTLSRGVMSLAGRTISLKDVKIPVYNLATREDHIAPSRSVFHGSSLFGGPVEFVLSGSGHIAGVVNPPDRQKYQYWRNGKPRGDYDAWVAKARETTGSWWGSEQHTSELQAPMRNSYAVFSLKKKNTAETKQTS